jgi:hypothetical protein
MLYCRVDLEAWTDRLLHVFFTDMVALGTKDSVDRVENITTKPSSNDERSIDTAPKWLADAHV